MLVDVSEEAVLLRFSHPELELPRTSFGFYVPSTIIKITSSSFTRLRTRWAQKKRNEKKKRKRACSQAVTHAESPHYSHTVAISP